MPTMHCAAAVQKLTEVAKNCEKDALRGFKVIQGRRIRHQSKGICFLLVVCNNLGTVSELRRLIGQSCLWDIPVSLNALAWGDPLRI